MSAIAVNAVFCPDITNFIETLVARNIVWNGQPWLLAFSENVHIAWCTIRIIHSAYTNKPAIIKAPALVFAQNKRCHS